MQYHHKLRHHTIYCVINLTLQEATAIIRGDVSMRRLAQQVVNVVSEATSGNHSLGGKHGGSVEEVGVVRGG